MADTIRIEVLNADKVAEALRKFPRQATRYFESAGREAGEEIVNTRGLRSYPPATAANQPPTPYYIRGRGTQYKARNDMRSERYGTQFFVKAERYTTTIGNRASYARWLAGQEQARAMADIGWRKLFDVATEKVSKITGIYNAWVDKLLRDVGLKE